MRTDDVARLLLGTFERPADETDTGQPRVEAVDAYLIRLERGLLVLDTGTGEGDAETEAWYRPRWITLQQALGQQGVNWVRSRSW